MPTRLVRGSSATVLGSARGAAPRARAGFSLLDLLVTIAVMVILMGIMLPALSHVSEATKRVVCRSNVRQIGLALQTHAGENRGKLPFSQFAVRLRPGQFSPQETMALRVDGGGDDEASWDGLGILYDGGFLTAPEVFYCPSHRGEHSMETYQPAWAAPNLVIVGNYHLQAFVPEQNVLHDLDPATPLVADGMRTISDFNHKTGCNVLRADMSLSWFEDKEGLLTSVIPQSLTQPDPEIRVSYAWHILKNNRREGFIPPWQPQPGTLPNNSIVGD